MLVQNIKGHCTPDTKTLSLSKWVPESHPVGLGYTAIKLVVSEMPL